MTSASSPRRGCAGGCTAALGRAGAGLIARELRPRQVLFLDVGTTNLAVALAPPADLGLTVVTAVAPSAQVAAFRALGIETHRAAMP